MMLPGVSSSAQVVQLKDSMLVLDKITDEEIANPRLIKGLRLRRIAADAERPIPFVNEVLHRYAQTDMMHRLIHKLQKKGMPLPESMEEAAVLMSYDPQIARLDPMRRKYERKMRRRNGK